MPPQNDARRNFQSCTTRSTLPFRVLDACGKISQPTCPRAQAKICEPARSSSPSFSWSSSARSPSRSSRTARGASLTKRARKKNPISPSDADLASIRPIYRDKCSSCHGFTGKGDGHDASLYDPRPTDFTDAPRMSRVTDGELFYKLTEGRKPMPSFKKRLTDEQRWRMVLLLRAFTQPSPDAPRSNPPKPQ